MIAAVKVGEVLISTARITSKTDGRITFQDWILKAFEKSQLNKDKLIQAYQAIGGPWLPTYNPYDWASWDKKDAYRGKILFYTQAHRYILLSTSYEYNKIEKWRIDTHFLNGRIWVWHSMPKDEFLSMLEKWSYRSRSKDFCWVISFLLGVFFCTQEIKVE
jgi:hypothetical protein